MYHEVYSLEDIVLLIIQRADYNRIDRHQRFD
jgi:hypothetical protein